MKYDPANPGRPIIGTESKCLGVRTTDEHADVRVEADGFVILDGGGMSVTRDWRSLPGYLIPIELDDGLNGAKGKKMAVFVHGTGEFSEGIVAPGLVLQFKSGTAEAGNICPDVAVVLGQYCYNLAATVNDWVIDPS